jgi:hypothetical protein
MVVVEQPIYRSAGHGKVYHATVGLDLAKKVFRFTALMLPLSWPTRLGAQVIGILRFVAFLPCRLGACGSARSLGAGTRQNGPSRALDAACLCQPYARRHKNDAPLTEPSDETIRFDQYNSCPLNNQSRAFRNGQQLLVHPAAAGVGDIRVKAPQPIPNPTSKANATPSIRT